MLNSSKSIENNLEDSFKLATKLKDYAVALFGMNQDNVDETLIDSAVAIVFLRYKGISFEDIFEAYNDATVVRKQYGVTRDELLAPIANYWAKKTILISAVNEYENELNRQNKEAIDFKAEAIRLYVECVNSDGMWTGTVYQSTAIAKDCLSDQFSKESKQELVDKAKQLWAEYMKDKKDDENYFNSMKPKPTWDQWYSHTLTLTACEQRKPILID